MAKNFKLLIVTIVFLIPIFFLSCEGETPVVVLAGGPDISPETETEDLAPATNTDEAEITVAGDDISNVDPTIEGDPDLGNEPSDGTEEDLTDVLADDENNAKDPKDIENSKNKDNQNDVEDSNNKDNQNDVEDSNNGDDQNNVEDSNNGDDQNNVEDSNNGDDQNDVEDSNNGDDQNDVEDSNNGDDQNNVEDSNNGDDQNNVEDSNNGDDPKDSTYTLGIKSYPEQNLKFSIDTSKGEWFQEPTKELFSTSKATYIKSQIDEFKRRIKLMVTYYRDKIITRMAAKEGITLFRGKIAESRNEVGNCDNQQGGIVAKKGNQNFFINIEQGEPGWYRLFISAKNSGTLPPLYDRFSFNIIDNSTNEVIGAASVKASEKVYNTGITEFELKNPTGKKLNLVWTNDAYLEGKYDTNLNIKRVILKKISSPEIINPQSRTMNGDNFKFMDGRWFFEKTYAYTNWSGQTIGYTFRDLEEGVYEVTVLAKNHGDLDLPENYKEYNIEIDSDYDLATLNVPAHSTEWQQGTTTMNLPEGETTLYLTWTNNSYTPDKYDTNIMIKSVSIKKIQPSSLTAYLLRTKPGNSIFIMTIFILLSGILTGIYFKNRNRVQY